MILISDDDILRELTRFTVPASLNTLCAQFGVERNRTGRYSKSGYEAYAHVGRSLQRLKRAGKVEYVGGSGAGWRISRGRSA